VEQRKGRKGKVKEREGRVTRSRGMSTVKREWRVAAGGEDQYGRSRGRHS
jgi:hypothetical protein